ncbi:NAD+ synthase [Aquihabitans sp. G128]|uniref:NAD+ synthase n=1 Tax=Aquihabitans sp. G128 TaxID=2849779 RepID=UPI001C23969A|nr:NAD+ synthase [Aquihabitans sp. G128]QXC60087.1 NAD+ synthase [Aquihabitans sp. G128]
MPRLRIASCQLNTRVGALDHNVELILAALEQASEAGCDLAVFPELAITGYPPEDLLLKPGFIADNRAALEKVAAETRSCVAVVGFVDADRDLYNAAAVCAHGEVVGIYHKRELPNYAVFDEARYFARGQEPAQLWNVGGVRVGVSICEDAWNPAGPILDQADSGAELIVNLNASPYFEGKLARRERLMATRAADASCALVYVNQVGGQDELVFDGGSMVFDADGELVARSPQFTEDVLIVDLDVDPVYRKRLLDPRGRPTDRLLPVAVTRSEEVEATDERRSVGAAPLPAPSIAGVLDPDEEVYRAIVVGTRDYLVKNGFGDVVIGLSGGIDSTLVAAIAVDAIGAEHVHGVSMPSRYSSDHSRSDAALLAENLGIEFRTIAIEPAHAAELEMLAPSFEGRDADLTEENLQSRIRGLTLMALSNKFGWIVLSTGNKSEVAVGYATLYGDTIGGYSVLKDVYKTRVYDLCRWRNTQGPSPVIPEGVIDKPPSAELRPDQRDDQSLPPYDVLDPILEGYIEHDRTVAELIARGHDEAIVRRVAKLVDGAEYKRRQSPIGVKVSVKAFGKDRRLPITNGYR